MLRYLVGGATEDLRVIYGVSLGEVYSSIWRCVDSVNRALVIDFPINDPAKLAVLEAEFRARSRSKSWTGQVGAVDGVHFRMRNPGKAVDDALAYYVHRKSEYALLATAVCDARCRFLFWSFDCKRTVHDSVAWSQCELGMKVANGELPSEYFLNGDAAYILSDQMVVPYGTPGFTDFDYVQSSNRIVIERAFGVMIRRCPPLPCHPLSANTTETTRIKIEAIGNSFF